MSSRRLLPAFFLSLSFLLSGCAALQFQMAEVAFPHPFFQSDFSNLPANEEEAQGVLLRWRAPSTGERRYREQSILFARARENRGLKVAFDMRRVEKFSAGKTPGAWVRTSEVEVTGGGKITEKEEITGRGEVARFMEGHHRSEMGKFEVLDLKRGPVFPETPARIGDRWTYEEETSVRLKSFWIKQKGHSLHKIQASSELKGFTVLDQRRVAVIYTRMTDASRMAFSIFFKDIEFTAAAEIEEIMYFDYKEGVEVEKITNTHSITSVPGMNLADEGKAQLVSRLEERATS